MQYHLGTHGDTLVYLFLLFDANVILRERFSKLPNHPLRVSTLWIHGEEATGNSPAAYHCDNADIVDVRHYRHVGAYHRIDIVEHGRVLFEKETISHYRSFDSWCGKKTHATRLRDGTDCVSIRRVSVSPSLSSHDYREERKFMIERATINRRFVIKLYAFPNMADFRTEKWWNENIDQWTPALANWYRVRHLCFLRLSLR